MIYLVYIGLYLGIMTGTFSFGIYKLIHKCFMSGGINLGIGTDSTQNYGFSLSVPF